MHRVWRVTFVVHFCVIVLQEFFCFTVIYYLFQSNNLHIIVEFQVFLSNTNNYMISSNYFYLIVVICLDSLA